MSCDAFWFGRQYQHFRGICCFSLPILEDCNLDMTSVCWVQVSRNIQHLHSCCSCIHCHQLIIQVTIVWHHQRWRLLLGINQTSPTTAQTLISISNQCWEQSRLDMVLTHIWPQPRMCKTFFFTILLYTNIFICGLWVSNFSCTLTALP